GQGGDAGEASGRRLAGAAARRCAETDAARRGRETGGQAMTRPPKPPSRAAKPVDVVGQTLERALDPLTSALKRAALRRADRQAHAFDREPAAAASAKAGPAKGTAPVSPLAVPFPRMPPIAGLQLATGRAGFYKHERDDLMVMSFPEGAS